MDSPNEILAKKIVARLMQERLLLPKDEVKALKKLVSGDLSGDDWKVFIENAVTGGKVP